MSKEDTIYYAKLAEQAERYDDMVKHMKQIATVDSSVIFRLEKNLPMRNAICSVLLIRTLWEQGGRRGEQ